MIEEIKSKTVCVVDHGLFIPLALRLARGFKRVLYYTPWEKGFPLINDCVIGDGFEEMGVERIDGIWKHLDEIDLFVFPDIQHSCLQLHLESLGKRVWGSRAGDSLELDRTKFLKTLKELELPQPTYRTIWGIDKLREYLKENEDKFIKISKFRGSMETWRHVSYPLSDPVLDSLAVKFGAVKNSVPFVVCDPIDSDIEVGFDGYCVDGQFPKLAVQGYECKDRGFIASVQKYSDMPKEVTLVNDAFAPILQEFRYRNFFSTEIRVKDGKSYFIDPCMRCPSPSTESQLELYKNLPEIIWAGASGELVEPEIAAKFAIEAVMTMKGDKQSWVTVDIPEKVWQWVKIGSCCFVDGRYAIPPDPNHDQEIGWLLGIGDTIQEAINHLFKNIALLTDDRIKIDTDSLVDLLREVHKAEKQDIEFTDQKVPPPEAALKNE